MIDFEGFRDDEPFEGGKGEDTSLELGSGRMIPGFEDGLVGASSERQQGPQLDLSRGLSERGLSGCRGRV